MYSSVQSKQLLDSLREPEHIARQRENLNRILSTLKESKKILQRDSKLPVENQEN